MPIFQTDGKDPKVVSSAHDFLPNSWRLLVYVLLLTDKVVSTGTPLAHSPDLPAPALTHLGEATRDHNNARCLA